MKQLTECANICGTDKGTGGTGDSMSIGTHHGYTEFYNQYFQEFKNLDKPVNILEIGVFKGNSLKMYDMFFDGNCEIYGIDLQDINEFKKENVHTYIANQGNRDEVDDFIKKMEEQGITFDIIIDDGSHVPSHQQMCLMRLHHLLNDNGIYVIEDMHTDFYNGFLGNNPYSYIDVSTGYFLDTLCFRKQYDVDDYYSFISKYDTITTFRKKTNQVVWDASIGTINSITTVIKFK